MEALAASLTANQNIICARHGHVQSANSDELESHSVCKYTLKDLTFLNSQRPFFNPLPNVHIASRSGNREALLPGLPCFSTTGT